MEGSEAALLFVLSPCFLVEGVGLFFAKIKCGTNDILWAEDPRFFR